MGSTAFVDPMLDIDPLGRLVVEAVVARGECAEGWPGGHVFSSDCLHVSSLRSLTSLILVLACFDPRIYWMLRWLVRSSPFCVCLAPDR